METVDQSTHPAKDEPGSDANLRFGIGLARAFGGAIIFSLPILMTMEMWHLGFAVDPFRLSLLLITVIPLLVGLSHYSGFEETFGWKDDAVDAFVAYAVGFLSSAVVLFLFAVIRFGMSGEEVIGKVSLQAVPASIGAMLAQSQLGGGDENKGERKWQAGYGGEVFFMAVGALFLTLNLAPTEEMVLIAYKMSEWHAVALAVVSLLILHAFVYALEFHGQVSAPPGTPFWSVFVRFTVVGYAVALLMSFYILWTFGQTDGLAPDQIMMVVIVLGFPAAVGAAAARLLL